MSRAEVLLNDYNHYRLFTSGFQQRRYKSSVGKTPAARAKYLLALERMAQWCVKQGIDPRHWLYTLFDSRHWLHSPPLKHLTSTRHLKRYPDREDTTTLFQKRVEGELEAKIDERGDRYHAGRDISYGVERLKWIYAQRGQYQRCMELILTETFGYHPKSTVCVACPIAVTCEAQLRLKVPFDAQAVRLGEMTLRQAQTAAAYHGGS